MWKIQGFCKGSFKSLVLSTQFFQVASTFFGSKSSRNICWVNKRSWIPQLPMGRGFCCCCFTFYLFLEIWEGREEERERNINQLPLTCPSTKDLASNPGMFPDQELNAWPFGLQGDAQPTGATGLGRGFRTLTLLVRGEHCIPTQCICSAGAHWLMPLLPLQWFVSYNLDQTEKAFQNNPPLYISAFAETVFFYRNTYSYKNWIFIPLDGDGKS